MSDALCLAHECPDNAPFLERPTAISRHYHPLEVFGRRGWAYELGGGLPRTLDELALKHGTDKSSKVHFYTRHYERYFAPLRDKELKILEIGIQEGKSLKMWRDYFPNATIIGVDKVDSGQYGEDRVIIVQADQSKENQLLQLISYFGSFDIIIDDGSHINKDMLLTFETLFPALNPGGLYVVEDLHTCYWGYGFGRPTFIKRLKKLIDEVNSGGKSGLANNKKDYLEGGFRGKPMTWWERNVEYMHLYRGIVFMKRYE